MIVVALAALAAWGNALRRRSADLDSTLRIRSAELNSALKRLSAEFTSKARQHHEKIAEFYINLSVAGRWWSRDKGKIPASRALDQTPQDSERQLRHLEHFYGYGLTTRDQAGRTLLLLWLRYEVYMYFKYRRAADRPWAPVDPDPPVPPLDPYLPQDEEWWRDSKLQMRIAEYLKILPNLVPE